MPAAATVAGDAMGIELAKFLVALAVLGTGGAVAVVVGVLLRPRPLPRDPLATWPPHGDVPKLPRGRAL